MKIVTLSFFAIAISTLFLLTSPNLANGASCGKLPSVDWWSKSHSAVRMTVEGRFDGDWERYIGRWRSYLKHMAELYEADSIAVVKSRGIKLRGQQLADHIKDIKARLSVLNCLKNNPTEPSVNDLENFETAANGKPPRSFSATKVTAITGKRLDIEVTAKCEKGIALFQITNLGDKWPQLGEINIYQVDTKALLSKRRVRMANSQQATFRIRRRNGRSYGTVGLWLSPSWEKRDFIYDAKITCK